MGFFKDIRTVTKQAEEIDKTFDPGQHSPPEDAVTATAQIVSIGASSGMVNMDPIVPLELLVRASGLPPRPASISAVVPMTQLGRLQPGAQLNVRVSRSDPTAIAVIWS